MIELAVVRHGESIRNYASKLAHQGNFELLDAQLRQDDYEPGWTLTDAGKAQAAATGKWLRTIWTEPPKEVLVSPYRRTLQTTKSLGLELYTEEDWRLRERRWGDYTESGEPYDGKKYLEDLAHAGEYNWKTGFPGGESVADLIPQVREFVQERLAPLPDGSRIILVTHGGAMKALQMVLEGQVDDPHQSSVPNASVLHFLLKHINPDGSAEGDVEQACPWSPDTGHAWQHFG